ncbi:MAG: alanyl-tRNA editing protein [Candidatus Diapherotrites archaeon]|nr:alanyl-tRNA editing protein [Candidatus Diapherotrites archaeon]
MKDCYIKEFDANVIENGRDYVVLDRTAFYPEGGGQESDTGTLDDIRVIKVKKDGGKIKHFVEAPIENSVVHGVIDWDRRYKHMRMHTAQHLVSAIVLDRYGAETKGNQIHADYSRIDFSLDKITQEMVDEITRLFNDYVDKSIPVKIYFTNREEVIKTIDERRRNLFNRVPSFVKEIRVVEIVGVDKCPCAGTHVSNTNEIGHIKIKDVVSKGKGITRIVYELVK